MVDTLASSIQLAEKENALHRLGIIPEGQKTLCSMLIEEIVPSSQLTSRLQYLREHTGVKPLDLSELPETPPHVEAREAAEKALKERLKTEKGK